MTLPAPSTRPDVVPADGARMETRAWCVTAVAGAVLLLPMMTLSSGLVLELAWVGLGTAAFVATRVGLRLHPPAHRGAHQLISAAAALIAVAAALEVSWFAPTPASPAVTLASVLYLGSFALLAVAMYRFVTMRMPAGDADGLIDSSLVAIATAGVMFDTLSRPSVTGVYSDAGSAALVLLPLLMAGVLASIVRVLLTGAHRHLSAWLFLGAAASSISANVLFITVAPDPTDLRLRPLFYGGYVLLACAVLHPSSAHLARPAAHTARNLTFGRLAIIGVALASLPAVMVRGAAGGSRLPAVAAIACVGLVLWRIARLLADRERAAGALHHRAEREAALSAIGRAAVTAPDPATFVDELSRDIDRALGATSSRVRPDVDRDLDTELVVPLGPGIGALAVRFPGGDVPDEEDRRFVRTAADLASAALRRWEVEDQLRHRSLHDHLTGLPNRASISQHLERAITRAEVTGGALVVLFIDLDGFKRVNDTLGHAAGDELLAEVAERLCREARPEDVVGRLAGDEFVVVCEDASVATATGLAHRLLDAVAAPFELDLDTHIGASIGMARALPGDDPAALLGRADAAMYDAKDAGKGRIVVNASS